MTPCSNPDSNGNLPRTVANPDDAVERLKENAESLKMYFDSFFEAKRDAHDSMFGRPYGVEERANDLMILVQRLAVSIRAGLIDAAEAIESTRTTQEATHDNK